MDDPDRLRLSDTRFRRRGGPESLTILSFSRSDLLTVPSCSPKPTVKPVPRVSQRRRRIEAVYRAIKVTNGKPKAQEQRHPHHPVLYKHTAGRQTCPDAEDICANRTNESHDGRRNHHPPLALRAQGINCDHHWSIWLRLSREA